MARVAITGIGAVTPVGRDAPSTWEALKAGRSGVGTDHDIRREHLPGADRRHGR
jgi:3-oxoacyl-(acyl-carrier-protein) synthase